MIVYKVIHIYNVGSTFCNLSCAVVKVDWYLAVQLGGIILQHLYVVLEVFLVALRTVILLG